MILTCPQCATRYQVDGAKFPASGRNVRCAKCGHTWHESGPAEDPDIAIEDQPPEPEPTPVEEEQSWDTSSPAALRAATFPPTDISEDASSLPDEALSRRLIGRVAVAAGWVLLVVLVLIIGWAAIAMRDSIATWLPQTSSAYSAVGLKVNPLGMDFADIKYQSELEDGQVVLAVTGALVNRSSHELPVPLVRVGLFDANEHELYQWTFAPGIATLKPGQTSKFRTRLSNPPNGIHDMELRFSSASE